MNVKVTGRSGMASYFGCQFVNLTEPGLYGNEGNTEETKNVQINMNIEVAAPDSWLDV